MGMQTPIREQRVKPGVVAARVANFKNPNVVHQALRSCSQRYPSWLRIGPTHGASWTPKIAPWERLKSGCNGSIRWEAKSWESHKSNEISHLSEPA